MRDSYKGLPPGRHMAMVNGEIVPYDKCSHLVDNTPPSVVYPLAEFEYFGTGYVHSVGGIVQGGERRPCHFYRRIDR